MLFTIRDLAEDAEQLRAAADILRAGGLVAIPTETVYGLAANALDPNAARAIYAAKGRPTDNPLIVHVGEVAQIAPLVREMPDALLRLAERFWPGPMTVVLPRSAAVPDATAGGLDTVAVRIPSNPIARELIRLAGVPLAAPSANLSGKPSPTSAAHCMADLDGRVDAVVDGGCCVVGVESTVLTLCTQPPKILRPGAVTLEMLREVLPDIVLDEGVFAHLSDNAPAASPGMKYKHYAPRARVVLVRGNRKAFAAFLACQSGEFGVLGFEGDQVIAGEKLFLSYGQEMDTASQARGLFDALRQIDEYDIPLIYARIYANAGLGQAVYNRLLRAAAFEQIELEEFEGERL